jgi:hypothetical protein
MYLMVIKFVRGKLYKGVEPYRPAIGNVANVIHVLPYDALRVPWRYALP